MTQGVGLTDMADERLPIAAVDFLTRHGTIAAYATDHPIATALARYGEWAEAEIETLSHLLGPGDVVLDVGAHVGVFTMALARKVGRLGKVMSFEPQRALFDLLKRNIATNELSQIVEVRNAAIGRSRGYVRLPLIDYSQAGNFGAVAPETRSGGSAESGDVPLLRIDDLQLPKCRLIKVDAEGAELDVVKGARETIRRLRPIVTLEAHSIEAAWNKVEALRDLSLKTWLLATPAFNPLNWRGDPEDFFDLAYECAVLGAAEEDEQSVRAAARLGALLTPVSNIDELARAFVEVPLPSDAEFDRASARQNLRRMYREKAESLRFIRGEEDKLRAALSAQEAAEANLQTSSAEAQKLREELERSQANLQTSSAEAQKLRAELERSEASLSRANQERELVIGALNQSRSATQRVETEREDARLQIQRQQVELHDLGEVIREQNQKAAIVQAQVQQRLQIAQDLAVAAQKIGQRPVWNLQNYVLYCAARFVKRHTSLLSPAWRKKMERTLRKKDPSRFARMLTTGDEESDECNPAQREIIECADAKAAPSPSKQSIDFIVRDIAAAGKFDRKWYLSKYPDIQQAGADPLKHYVSIGWLENRDPASWFSTSYYLSANPDVAAAGVNPFWHYIVAGQKEGRQIAHPGGPAAAMLSKLVSLSEQRTMQQALPAREHLRRLDENDFVRLIKTGARTHRLLIALGHDDYRRISGGVQLCLQIEQKAATTDWGGSYLNLHPRVSLPTLVPADSAEAYDMVAVLNGETLGVVDAGAVCSALENLAPGFEISIVVHSLLGHATEFVARLYQAVRAQEVVFWVHDYFAACTSHTLMRNGIQFCSAPPVESAACQICVHGSERSLHQQRMRTLLEGVPFRLVAPSQAAKRIWSSATGYNDRDFEVLPHCTFGKVQPVSDNPSQHDAPPARIAFLGYNTHHKGWNVFAQLARTFAEDARYQFLHLGSGNECISNILFEDVSVAAHGRDAMSQAVARLDVDIALTWSIKPETFGFVGYEAIAGGAKIVAWEGGGHLAELARIPGNGLALPDIDALHEAFRDGRIHDLAGSRRSSGRIIRELIFSRMSIDLLAQPTVSKAVI